MSDSGMLFLSLTSIVVGGALFLSPKFLLALSSRLNISRGTVDQWVVRYRYIAGVLAFVAGYGFFRLALLLPTLGR